MFTENILKNKNIFLIFLLLVLFVPYVTFAHESRPLYLEINETVNNVYSLSLKTPRSIPEINVPLLIIPSDCRAKGNAISIFTPQSYVTKQKMSCPGAISEKILGLEYPLFNPSVSTIIRINLLSGEKYSKLLSPGESSWKVPEMENRLGIAKEYVLLGMTHIWDGIDHLLFLLCLIFIAFTPRRILITITGFTIAHSVTLVLSTLGIVKLPVPPVEAAIALSIVFVASEIARGKEDSLTYRYPVTVSSSFGLLHGFGFASVLRDTGLPQTELPVSLLFFNIGVEIGQVIFIVAVLFVLFFLNSVTSNSIKALFRYDKLAAYVIGSVASFWMLQRIFSFWS